MSFCTRHLSKIFSDLFIFISFYLYLPFVYKKITLYGNTLSNMPTNKPLLPSYSGLSHVDVEVVLLPVPWVGRLKVY